MHLKQLTPLSSRWHCGLAQAYTKASKQTEEDNFALNYFLKLLERLCLSVAALVDLSKSRSLQFS